jgi:hypothetical protein
MAFGIAAPSGVEHLLGDWLANWNVKHKRQILVGVTALCWSIWLCRNDVEFNRKNFNSLLQVVFRGTYWTRTWAALSRREEEKNNLKNACRKLETVVMQVFNNFGWENRNRLHA